MRKIEMPRGDVYAFPFSFYDAGGEKITAEMDNIWFTVKKKYTDTEYIIQKTLRGGTISSDGKGNYAVMIRPEDTEGLSFGTYVYDIQVQRLPGLKHTETGLLELRYEVTYRENEGEEPYDPGTDNATEADTAVIIAGETEVTREGNEGILSRIDLTDDADIFILVNYPEIIPDATKGNENFWGEIATAAEVAEVMNN